MKNSILKKVVSLITVISTVFAMACTTLGCGKRPEQPSGGDETKVTVTMSQDTAVVEEFETVKLAATADGSTDPVVWSSDDETVATVDGGVVYGVKSGKCVITATVGKSSAKCSLTVTSTVYAPVIRVADEITIEKGKSYTGGIGVTFKGKDVLSSSAIEWSVEDGKEEICRVSKGERTVTFAAEKLGESAYYVSATYNGIYVNKRIIVRVIEPIATVVPDGDDVTVGNDGYEVKLFTLLEAGKTEIPLTFTVYRGETVVKNAAIEWDTSAAGYNPRIAKVSGENGNYVVKKIAAGTSKLSGAYRTSDGKSVSVFINVTVAKAAKEIDFRPTIEIENLKAIDTPAAVSGKIESITLDGENVYSYTSDKKLYLNKAKFPKSAAKLGAREMILSTPDAEYRFTADIYTLIITDKSGFDKMRTVARDNGNFGGTGTLDGYFVLGGDVAYNGVFTSMTDSGELWQTNAKLGGGGWNNSSKYGFKGVFDGRGYNVDGLTVKAILDRESGGVFGYMNNAGVVRNVSFTNAGLYENSGFICSYGGGLIENVSVAFASMGVGNENRDLFDSKNAPRTMGAFYSCGADEFAVVRNCVVDAMGADIRYVIDPSRSDLANVVLATQAKKAENVVVMSNHPKAGKILAESGSPYTASSYAQLSSVSLLRSVIREFDAKQWTIINGIPLVKRFAESIDVNEQVDFVALNETVAIGGSAAIKANTRYAEVVAEGLYDGVTFDRGVLTVAETASAGTITLKATSYINGSTKSARVDIINVQTVAPAHERKLLELADNQLDLSFANAYLGDKATVTYGETIVGKGSLSGGKLTVDLTKIDAYGELALKVISEKGGIYYSFDCNVRLATKIIRTAADLDVLKIKDVSIYGLYVLGNDVNLNGAKISQKVGGEFWSGGYGFRGTFDGQNHTISNFTAGESGLFGHIGKGGVVKNVKFTDVKYAPDYLTALLARTISGAEISNVSVSVASYAIPSSAKESHGLLCSRWLENTTLTNVRVDASAFDVYLLFGYTVKAESVRCDGVVFKVKSYVLFGYKDNAIAPDQGVSEMKNVTVETAG